MRFAVTMAGLFLAMHTAASPSARVFELEAELRNGTVVLAQPRVQVLDGRTAVVEVGPDSDHPAYRWTVTATSDADDDSRIVIDSSMAIGPGGEHGTFWTLPQIHAKAGDRLDYTKDPGQPDGLTLRLRVNAAAAPPSE